VGTVEARKMAEKRAAATVEMIKCAIQDGVCLSGTHLGFLVRFAPYALGRGEDGRQIVIASESSGLTVSEPNWVYFVVDYLRGLQRSEDPHGSGPLATKPPFNLTEVEAAIDDGWWEDASRRPAK